MWAEGEAEERHYERTGRSELRKIEAHMLLAGYERTYSGMVALHEYGLTVETRTNTHFLMPDDDGWAHYLVHPAGDVLRIAHVADYLTGAQDIASRFEESIFGIDGPSTGDDHRVVSQTRATLSGIAEGIKLGLADALPDLDESVAPSALEDMAAIVHHRVTQHRYLPANCEVIGMPRIAQSHESALTMLARQLTATLAEEGYEPSTVRVSGSIATVQIGTSDLISVAENAAATAEHQRWRLEVSGAPVTWEPGICPACAMASASLAWLTQF